MNLNTLIIDLQTYIDSNKLVKAAVAKKIAMSPSGLSHLLARDFNPTGEQALAILNLTKGTQPMTTITQISDSEGLDTINASVIARYSKNHATIENFQSALNDGTGWVPGVYADPVNDGSIADPLSTAANRQ